MDGTSVSSEIVADEVVTKREQRSPDECGDDPDPPHMTRPLGLQRESYATADDEERA